MSPKDDQTLKKKKKKVYVYEGVPWLSKFEKILHILSLSGIFIMD